MKTNFTKAIVWVLLILSVVLSIPYLTARIEHEENNDNVVVALLYNDLKSLVSQPKLDEYLDKYMEIGVDTLAVMEEDMNTLVTAGELTCIKYNVLLHKYDDESIRVGEAIRDNCPDVGLDSYIILAKRPEARQKLSYHLPRRYTEADYMYVGEHENMDIYVLYDGSKELWNYPIGYDVEDIDEMYNRGFKIALVHKIKNYFAYEYLDDLENIIEKYDVEYLNLKEDEEIVAPGTENIGNYTLITDMILKNDLTLVVTETETQLSNERFMGYDNLFYNVVGTGRQSKVLRSYENYDESQADSTMYKFRTSQHFNSTIDRNARFIVVTQIGIEKTAKNYLAELTFKSTDEYVQKIKAEGFSVNGEVEKSNYNVYKGMNYALGCVIMVMAVMIMVRVAFGSTFPRLTFLSVLVALIGFVVTLYMPARFYSLLSLYPTLYSLIMSCFAMTMVLLFVKSYKDKFPTIMLTSFSLVIMMACLLIGSVGLGSMLSGIQFYINNEIFRGIKLSLLVPIAYTAVLYYLMFMRKKDSNILKDVKKLLCADIKVFWVLIGAFVAFVAIYYILRSGNVESISSIEATVRTKLTEIFTARPRTKEFLIGYPALFLFCYYTKNTKITLISWLLAIATSILSASVTNSFCHVFTDYMTIVDRSFNGLLVGLIVTFFVIIANAVIVKATRYLSEKLKDEE